jgi:hypothetical protein
MNLADRRRGERFRIKRREHLGDVSARFAPDYLLYVSEWKRCDPVEQLKEFVAATRGQEVKPQSERLTEFDPGYTELLEGQTQPECRAAFDKRKGWTLWPMSPPTTK